MVDRPEEPAEGSPAGEVDDRPVSLRIGRYVEEHEKHACGGLDKKEEEGYSPKTGPPTDMGNRLFKSCLKGPNDLDPFLQRSVDEPPDPDPVEEDLEKAFPWFSILHAHVRSLAP